jgi:hypothetical protein
VRPSVERGWALAQRATRSGAERSAWQRRAKLRFRLGWRSCDAIDSSLSEPAAEPQTLETTASAGHPRVQDGIRTHSRSHSQPRSQLHCADARATRGRRSAGPRRGVQQRSRTCVRDQRRLRRSERLRMSVSRRHLSVPRNVRELGARLSRPRSHPEPRSWRRLLPLLGARHVRDGESVLPVSSGSRRLRLYRPVLPRDPVRRGPRGSARARRGVPRRRGTRRRALGVLRLFVRRTELRWLPHHRWTRATRRVLQLLHARSARPDRPLRFASIAVARLGHAMVLPDHG